MLRFLKCLFGFHGVVEYGDEVKECRDCLMEI
jgi:hypothetical protein